MTGWQETKSTMTRAKTLIEQAEQAVLVVDDPELASLRFALSGMQSMIDHYLVQRGSKERG